MRKITLVSHMYYTYAKLLKLTKMGRCTLVQGDKQIEIARGGGGVKGSLYRNFVHHVRRRGICLGAIYLQGMN